MRGSTIAGSPRHPTPCEIDKGLSDCKPWGDAGQEICSINDPVVLDHVGGLSGVERIAISDPERCALPANQTVWCWVANRGAARPINLQ